MRTLLSPNSNVMPMLTYANANANAKTRLAVSVSGLFCLAELTELADEQRKEREI